MNDDGIDLGPETPTSLNNTWRMSASEPGAERFRLMLNIYLEQAGQPPLSDDVLQQVEHAMAENQFSPF